MNSKPQRNYSTNLATHKSAGSNLVNYPSDIYPEELLDESIGLDLKEFIAVLSRRKKTVFITAILTVLFAFLITLLMQPVYRASSSIKVERYAANANIEILDNQVARNDRDFFETQIHLIQTKALAERVIKELNIDKQQTPEGLLSKLKKVLSFSSTAENTDTNNDMVSLFLDNLTVKPISNSQLLMISYDSSSPKSAATISNAIAKTFVRQNLERRFETASSYKVYVSENIAITKKSLEEAESRLNSYAQSKGIIQDSDGQSSSSHSLNRHAEELVQAKKERIEAEAAFTIFQQDQTKDVSSVISDPYILSLKKSAAKLETQYQALKNKKTRSAKRLRKQIDSIKNDIRTEATAFKSSLETSFLKAVKKEKMLSIQFADLKKIVLQTQKKTRKYTRLLREVEINQLAYNKQLEQLMAVNIASNVGTNNISIIDRATPPLKKFKPSLKTNIGFGLLLGLLLGMGFAFLREFIDDTIKEVGTLERISGLPVLSQLPNIKDASSKKIAMQTAIEPRSPLAESIRSLRTSLRFSTRNGSPQSIFITSSSATAGKTTLALNLATAYAQTGGKTLLIDADLRNPSLHKILELGNLQGLTNYLANAQIANKDISQTCMINQLKVITSGPIPPDPVELLSGHKMIDLIETASKNYDHIIIDGPPVLGLADSLVLANLAEATVITVEAGKTKKPNLLDSLKRLQRAQANIVGTVITKVIHSKNSEYDHSYYSYSSDNNADEVSRIRSI